MDGMELDELAQLDELDELDELTCRPRQQELGPRAAT
jgi:hypothetical protein